MKLTQKQRHLIAFSAGIILILLGLVQAIFNIKIDTQVSDNISLVLVIIAAGVLFGGKGKKKKDEEEEAKKEDEVKSEIEEKGTEDK
jgi:hypothetical protein